MDLRKAIQRVFPNAPSSVIMDCVERFHIENPIDFVAQLAHESGNFSSYVENLNYSAASLARVWPTRFANASGSPNATAYRIARNPKEIAKAVYNGRMGNRAGTDDGWNYRGRGAVQVTGRSNYERVSRVMYSAGLCDTPTHFLVHPEELGTLPNAIHSAGAFWNISNLSSVTDFKTLTKRINGGLTGYEDRLKKRKALEDAVNNLS